MTWRRIRRRIIEQRRPPTKAPLIEFVYGEAVTDGQSREAVSKGAVVPESAYYLRLSVKAKQDAYEIIAPCSWHGSTNPLVLCRSGTSFREY